MIQVHVAISWNVLVFILVLLNNQTIAQWRLARPERLERIHNRVRLAVDELVERDPLDVQLYSQIETACKDHGEQNSRFRLLATIARIEPELRNHIAMHRAYALGDRLFWHAKACRFAHRDKDFRLWLRTWERGDWDEAMREGSTLPVLPFYALVFPFNMTHVLATSVAWAAKFRRNAQAEALPAPLTRAFAAAFVRERRLRIGYASSDIYRIHPVGK